jgi:WD40 repeat protein
LRHSRRGSAADYLTFSPDGTALASGGYDGVIRVWDARPVQDTASR